MLRQLRTAIVMLLVFSILTGLIYPMAITGLAQLVWPAKANGSLLRRDGRVLGSELIGQAFDDPRYFWGRPSATGPYPYHAASSSGSNLSVTNASLTHSIRLRVDALRKSGLPANHPIPVDLVTASGSGLDPHISVAAAGLQIERVAKARGLDPAGVAARVDAATEGRQFGIFGEPRVNVLRLNLSLDTSAAAAVR